MPTSATQQRPPVPATTQVKASKKGGSPTLGQTFRSLLGLEVGSKAKGIAARNEPADPTYEAAANEAQEVTKPAETGATSPDGNQAAEASEYPDANVAAPANQAPMELGPTSGTPSLGSAPAQLDGSIQIAPVANDTPRGPGMHSGPPVGGNVRILNLQGANHAPQLPAGGLIAGGGLSANEVPGAAAFAGAGESQAGPADSSYPPLVGAEAKAANGPLMAELPPITEALGEVDLGSNLGIEAEPLSGGEHSNPSSTSQGNSTALTTATAAGGNGAGDSSSQFMGRHAPQSQSGQPSPGANQDTTLWTEPEPLPGSVRIRNVRGANLRVAMNDGSTVNARVDVVDDTVDVQLRAGLEASASAEVRSSELREALASKGLRLGEFDVSPDGSQDSALASQESGAGDASGSEKGEGLNHTTAADSASSGEAADSHGVTAPSAGPGALLNMKL